MLSLKESKCPLALFATRGRSQIVYYHSKEESEEPEHLDDPNLTDIEIQAVYNTIKGTNANAFPAKAFEFYQKAKQDYLNKIGKEITLPPASGGKFEVIPTERANQIQFTLVTGKNGSGKSYWTGQYMNMYHKMFPENPIFIFSKKNEDEAYDCHTFVTRIPLDEEFLETELDVEQFRDSLCVFDDIENCKKGVNEKVHSLLDNLSETGRSNNIYIILCNHLSMMGAKTKRSLNESDSVVIFKNSSPFHVKNLLSKYVGLDCEQIATIMSLPSRWVFIKKDEPQYVVTENKVFLLN